MPKLWSETIEAHRQQVRDAVLETTARLAGNHGLLNVTMSQIAQEAGIGRATLYKYFASIDEILHAWHERQVRYHLDMLTAAANSERPAAGRLAAVLQQYAKIQRQRAQHGTQHHGSELAARLHGDLQLTEAEHELRDLISDVLTEAADDGEVRDDIPPRELANYCLHALNAAGSATSDAAARRLVRITLAALRRDS